MTDPWFNSIAGEADRLSSSVLDALRKNGFVVVPQWVQEERLAELRHFYDQEVLSANPIDVGVGGSTTRVSDFVNRHPVFDALYLDPMLLAACCHVIGQPFKLSTMLARTLRPQTEAQEIHVDFPFDDKGWPMVGFILMVDDFRQENGATCFIPGSHGTRSLPVPSHFVPACGTAGSVIVFNGSVWHGHGANRTDEPRRSIQGAFIRRTEKSGGNLPSRMRQETLNRIGPLAKYLLEL